jgi:hypothetical protein
MGFSVTLFGWNLAFYLFRLSHDELIYLCLMRDV